jgi:hypothetical protein
MVKYLYKNVNYAFGGILLPLLLITTERAVEIMGLIFFLLAYRFWLLCCQVYFLH